MGAALGTLSEIRELKAEITGLRTDLRRFIERANQQHVENVLGDLKKNYAGLFSDHQVETARTDLSAHMVGDCRMREKCYGVFMEFLQNTSRHIKEGHVPDEIIQSYREQMKTLRSKGQHDRCDTCFTEVHRLFEKQVDLMQSLGIYQNAADRTGTAAEIADESVVKDLLEPVANVQRFLILKSLSVQTRTFSDISQLTGLKGGNLLFHVRKLTDAGMILQRHERGDYIITDKGYKTLVAISELSCRINGN
ncbi:winged helix-turn-helix domain-containing protein [Methanoregula sp.]|uniref:winged helix-turn-helix domain-containing protein n=1 Tax=Methanoregula sp. TaxID=2052170 RepID=UPI00236C84AB|nr:winged helix-turn-helix domain-containing protein [Methanoregula sp.]MDD1686390.1 winged helix-turn-helix domain-containing protein [Methanoregula sp.]